MRLDVRRQWWLAALLVALLLGLCATPRRVRPQSDAIAGRRDDEPRIPLRLDLNLPAYQLDVFEDGHRTRSLPVAIGTRRYRTPRGEFGIDHVVWNPWWIPPKSAWAAKEKPHAPGWENPVGRVKLHVHELVFLHGTPFEGSLGSAASHACVRMRNRDAIALARLVHAHASPDLSAELLDSLEADTARTYRIDLSAPIPISVRYVLAELRDDTLLVFPDVYGLAGTRTVASAMVASLTALARGGVDTMRVRRSRVAALVRRSRRAVARSPIDSLLLPPPRDGAP